MSKGSLKKSTQASSKIAGIIQSNLRHPVTPKPSANPQKKLEKKVAKAEKAQAKLEKNPSPKNAVKAVKAEKKVKKLIKKVEQGKTQV